MSKVDWLTAIEKGMVAARTGKTNPCLKTVGTGGDGGDFYGNENNINVSQTEGPVPTTQILVGTGGDELEAVPTVPTAEILVGADDEGRQSFKKQAITPCVPTLPTVPTNFDNSREISHPAPRITANPWQARLAL